MQPPRTLKGVHPKLDIAKYQKWVVPTQTLRRFTVIWCNFNGVPFNTTGFFATVSTVNGRLLQTVRFDSFGTAVFSRLLTPTRQRLVIRTFDSFGFLFRIRIVPAHVSSFVIIG